MSCSCYSRHYGLMRHQCYRLDNLPIANYIINKRKDIPSVNYFKKQNNYKKVSNFFSLTERKTANYLQITCPLCFLLVPCKLGTWVINNYEAWYQLPKNKQINWEREETLNHEPDKKKAQVRQAATHGSQEGLRQAIKAL